MNQFTEKAKKYSTSPGGQRHPNGNSKILFCLLDYQRKKLGPDEQALHVMDTSYTGKYTGQAY